MDDYKEFSALNGAGGVTFREFCIMKGLAVPKEEAASVPPPQPAAVAADKQIDFSEFLAMQSPDVLKFYKTEDIKSWFDAADVNRDGKLDFNEFYAMVGPNGGFTTGPDGTFMPVDMYKQVPSTFQGATASDTDEDYKRVPWWRQGSSFCEEQRKDRRTIFMHDDWVRHRSSERFLRNMRTIGSSGINSALSTELTFMTFVATFIVVSNCLIGSYQDLSGVVHEGPLHFLATNVKSLSLPALPFSIAMPALSLLLVFRTNTGYSRWNEARTLWGGLINNCRNVVRQSNTFFPDDAKNNALKIRMAAETAAFIRSLRNFLRGPTDDDTLRSELYDMVDAGVMKREQADATMAAANRPMFALSAMSATLRKADLDPIQASRIDSTISILVDLTGANERIFKSPIPLVYTRLTSRFLTFFLLLLPLALWGQLGDSWNHWATIPAEFVIAFFLFGIEEVGIQTEEPFSILPLEAFCNGAIAATNEEMLGAVKSEVFVPEP